jgi:hypothetical protein
MGVPHNIVETGTPVSPRAAEDPRATPVFPTDVTRRKLLRRPTGIQIVVSILVAALGILASKALAVVDQDLRNMYTEYTLAATNLAHISSDLLRYRVTVVRSIEAPSQRDFERIAKSLPDQRARVLQAVDRYAEASRKFLRTGSRIDQDLKGLRRSLEEYFATTDHTLILLKRLWEIGSPSEAAVLRHQVELHAAENAGPRLVESSNALERLLLGVAEIGKDMRDEGAGAIRVTSLVLVLGSLFIAALNLLT